MLENREYCYNVCSLYVYHPHFDDDVDEQKPTWDILNYIFLLLTYNFIMKKILLLLNNLLVCFAC